MKERLDQIKKELREANKMVKKSTHPALKEIYQKQADGLFASMAAIKLEIRHDKLVKRVEATGVTFADWLAWAESLYPITHNPVSEFPFSVVSEARQWKTAAMMWSFTDHVSCLEKIEQLVGYKIYDRKRGHGNMDQDLGVSAAL